MSSTVSVTEISWNVKCSLCPYEEYQERSVGESMGEVFDRMLLSFISPCPKCKGLVTERGKGN